MKIYLNFFIFVQLICFIHSITEYEYDYGTDFNDKDFYLDDHHREKWHHHQKFYDKKVGKVLDHTHDDHEYNYRYFVYKDNIMTVEDHNQAYKDGNVTFSLKENHYSHLTFEEFHDTILSPMKFSPPLASSKTKKFDRHFDVKPLRLKFKDLNKLFQKRSNSNQDYGLEEEEENNTYIAENVEFHHVNKFKQERYKRLAFNLKKSVQSNNDGIFTLKAKNKLLKSTNIVDWNAKGFITPVYDQGSCGSCYAYAVTGALENLVAVRANNPLRLRSLSEQQILDCSNDQKKNIGCEGGNIVSTYQYVQKNGLSLDSSYPYVSQDWTENPRRPKGFSQVCQLRRNRIQVSLKTIRSINNINPGDVATMKNVLKNQAISAYIYVEDDLFQYNTGIYTNDNCYADSSQCTAPNHAVLITGWGQSSDGTEYWIAKNSWGSVWGESGYFRIEAGKNMCCIEQFNSYASL